MTRRLSLLLAIALVTGCATSREDGAAPDDQAVLPGAPEALLSPLGDVEPWNPAILRAREVALLAVGDRLPPLVQLPLFEDATFTFRPSRMRGGLRASTWEGDVLEVRDSEVRVTLGANSAAGTVRVGERVFGLLTHGGRTVVVEWDPSAVPADAAPARVPARRTARAAVGSGAAAAQDARLDVLVVYTGAAAAHLGSAEAVEAVAELAVAETTASFEQSGVPAAAHLVAIERTEYDESGFDWQVALGRLADPTDGSMDEVPVLRDLHGADHVVLLVASAGPYAGIGYQLTASNAPYFAHYAYSVVATDYAVGNHTFAHELGHNLGANHDEANAGSGGYRHDAHGHRDPERAFRTIMAYSCFRGGCPRITKWSTPTRTHEGAPLGVVDAADNVRSLVETVRLASAFREAARPLEEAPHLLSPEVGSRLPAGPVTFQWTDVGAEEYELWVGRSVGDDGLFRGSAGTGRELVVSGLPQSGEALFVRLRARFAERWQERDEQVLAPLRQEGATVTFPAPGARLPGSFTWFGWTPIEGASAYRLQVGTEAESARYFDRDGGDRTWAFVAGLPVDGAPVQTRLWTLLDSGWTVTEARYEGYDAPVALPVITSPVTGSELPGDTVTFRVRDGDVPAGWLVVRGLLRVWHAERVEGDTHVVTGLPTDGQELLVLLYAETDTGWTATSAGYRAARL